MTATIQRHAEGATRMLLEGYGSIVKSFRDQIDAEGPGLTAYLRDAMAAYARARLN